MVGRAVESAYGKARHAENFTPQQLVDEMLATVPSEIWHRKNLALLDPCCGVGNFEAGVLRRAAQEKVFKTKAGALRFTRRALHLCEIQPESLDFACELLEGSAASVTLGSFLDESFRSSKGYDLIFGNPPYEELGSNGRKAKNHNLWSKFISKSITLLKPGGFLLFVVPPSWMSAAADLMSKLSRGELSLLHVDVGGCSKYFQVGSKFSYFLLQKTHSREATCFSYEFKGTKYLKPQSGRSTVVNAAALGFIPELPHSHLFSIAKKVLAASGEPSLGLTFDSDLHAFTKKHLLSRFEGNGFQYETVHTPAQTLWSARPHKLYGQSKLLIPLTTHIEQAMVSRAGVTQGMGYVLCNSDQEAAALLSFSQLKVIRLLVGATRWGNFNSPHILRRLPAYPGRLLTDPEAYDYFGLSDDEAAFVETAFR